MSTKPPPIELRMLDRVRELELFIKGLQDGTTTYAQFEFQSRALMAKRAFAFVVCHDYCEIQPLTEAEYNKQLANSNTVWQCPNCGVSADYHDELSERAQGVS